jgi:tetratricopeptide (TPR) repeat protein
MPYLSWQTIIVGDPLCAPFPHKAIDGRELDPAVDDSTELPGLFSRRRLEHVPVGLNKAASAAFVRAEIRKVRGDEPGVRQALEAAVAAEPRFTAVRLDLASQDDRDEHFDQAIAHYRAILAYNPNEAIALNNLAYDLAVHGHKPEEALPLSERACTLIKNSASFLDTLGWIQHLLKRDAEAMTTVRLARSGGSQNADLLWHAAVIYAAANDLPRAAAELTLALKVKPELANREDIARLRQQLNVAK